MCLLHVMLRCNRHGWLPRAHSHMLQACDAKLETSHVHAHRQTHQAESQAHWVAKDSLLAFTSQELGFQSCTTMPDLHRVRLEPRASGTLGKHSAS